MPEVIQKKMHLPLSPELHADLKEQAELYGVPATALAREAIEEWLERRQRERVAEEMRAYALAVAGTGADLDEDFEGAGIEAWLEHER